MIYGNKGTIHGTQKLNIEIDKRGGVVSVWFRCCTLPFDVTVVDESRAIEMANLSDDTNKHVRLNAVDIERDRPGHNHLGGDHVAGCPACD